MSFKDEIIGFQQSFIGNFDDFLSAFIVECYPDNASKNVLSNDVLVESFMGWDILEDRFD